MEKRLTDPAQYRAPLDRSEVLEEIESNKSGVDYERKGWMHRAAQDINEGGPLTIAMVERAAEQSRYARDNNREPAFRNFAILSALGDDALLQFLVYRANALAEGIQPGAKAALGDAF